MLIGLDVMRLLITRASMVQKLCVLPVSAMAVLVGSRLGGSTGVTDEAKLIDS
jgi:hypothetical protein